ncbi:MAG TPA: isoprenylcysteine carboxylmethyltransferase family protein [Thermoplasmata archaeon]|nr:isoprenylcysteine carboxylmethyltransferase family protein [Thermoplasmata archaeon]
MSLPPSRRILAIGLARVAAVLGGLAAVGIFLDYALHLRALVESTWRWVGLVPFAVGIMLEAEATRVLWRLGGGTPHPVSPPPRLVDQGPYAFSRNPLYLARILILLGVAWIFGSVAILVLDALLLLLVHFVLIPREEERLESRLGDTYRDYRGRVGRWVTWRRPHPEKEHGV